MDIENLNFIVIYSAWDYESRLKSRRSLGEIHAEVGEDWANLLLHSGHEVHDERHECKVGERGL